jgi:DNA topoisomerase-3
VYSLDFLPEFNNWDTTLPVALFNARAEKKEERGGMSRHLQTEAKGANYLVLWLDCDREVNPPPPVC